MPACLPACLPLVWRAVWYHVKGLCEIHDGAICLRVSTLHCTIQVTDGIVHDFHQFDLARPLTSETMLTVSKYAIYGFLRVDVAWLVVDV